MRTADHEADALWSWDVCTADHKADALWGWDVHAQLIMRLTRCGVGTCTHPHGALPFLQGRRSSSWWASLKPLLYRKGAAAHAVCSIALRGAHAVCSFALRGAHAVCSFALRGARALRRQLCCWLLQASLRLAVFVPLLFQLVLQAYLASAKLPSCGWSSYVTQPNLSATGCGRVRGAVTRRLWLCCSGVGMRLLGRIGLTCQRLGQVWRRILCITMGYGQDVCGVRMLKSKDSYGLPCLIFARSLVHRFWIIAEPKSLNTSESNATLICCISYATRSWTRRGSNPYNCNQISSLYASGTATA